MNNFKKYIMVLAAAPLLWSCDADQGAEPGSDPNPVVTLYSYEPYDDTLNPDNDVLVRFATNNKVKEIYYLLEKGDDADQFIQQNSEEAYMDKIVSTGTKIDVDGAQVIDKNFTELQGLYYISVVATDGGKKRTFSKVEFTGLLFEEVAQGTFYYSQKFLPESSECVLEKCTNAANTYRIRDAFGAGYNMKIVLMPQTKDEDENGEYYLFRIPPARTPFTATLKDGSVVDILAQDVGYYTGNAAYITSNARYVNYFYPESSTVDCNIAWTCSAGALGIGDNIAGGTSVFKPNE